MLNTGERSTPSTAETPHSVEGHGVPRIDQEPHSEAEIGLRQSFPHRIRFLLLFISPFTKGEAANLPGTHRLQDTFMPAHNAHLLLGIYEDEVGNKLLHIAGMRSSKGHGNIQRHIPIVVRGENGVIVEAPAEMYRL